MKINVLVSLVLSVSNVATAIKFISGPDGWAPAMGFNTTVQTWDDIEPLSVLRVLAPKRQEMKSRAPNVPGSKTVKIRYGPYTVPAPRVYVPKIYLLTRMFRNIILTVLVLVVKEWSGIRRVHRLTSPAVTA
jgi:hypothetical protein